MKWRAGIGVFVASAQACVLSEQRVQRSQRTESFDEWVTPRPDARADARTDASVDRAADVGDAQVATSRAGAECVTDAECDGLQCDRSTARGECTLRCTNSTSQVSEQRQCGGSGSTCLSSPTEARCARACDPRRRTSCREGFVCTNLWYEHRSETSEATGCSRFCAQDAHCNAGLHCNPRTGECVSQRPDESSLADGLPCTPPGAGQPSPCRGRCFALNDSGTTGICASLIDSTRTTSCPDEPDSISPIRPILSGTVELCAYRSCTATQCCPSGFSCVLDAAGDAEGRCTTADPGWPALECAVDGGVIDASAADAESSDSAVDGEGGR